ncbi:MAG: LysR family transcriptional regulator [Xanthobacteraceae bacterium]|nr:LysR family transcriptional regulator [Xanthobacteraceae bacterium]
MELRYLRSFCALAEELHFGRAARRLNLSQPPLSRQIALLEQELGTRLFQRTRRRVELTPAGAAFLIRAKSLLNDLNLASDEARRVASGQIGTLSLGMVASAAYSIMPGMLRAFHARHPRVHLSFESLATTDQIKALLQGRIDIGIVRLPVRSDGIAVHRLVDDPFVVALPGDHRLARQKQVSLRDLADEPFLISPREAAIGYHDEIVSHCERAGFSPRFAYQARPFSMLVGLVGAGLGVAIVPESMQHLRPDTVVYRPLRERTVKTAFALVVRESDGSPLVAQFIAVTRKALRDNKPDRRS